MEVTCVAGPKNTSSTSIKNVGKVQNQNMDAFSELLTVLFGNMLVSKINQCNLDISQTGNISLNNTVGNDDKISNVLSIISNLKISSDQLKETGNTDGNISSLLNNVSGNNTDFLKLLSMKDDMPEELKEFINNLNALNTSEAERSSTNPNSDTAKIILEQLNKNITNSEDVAKNDLKNIIPGKDSIALDALNTQTKNNTTAAGSKKISDLFNVHTDGIKTEKSSIEAEITPNNSSDTGNTVSTKNIKNIIETNTGENKFSDADGKTKDVKSEEKTASAPKTVVNFEQGIKLNDSNNEKMNMITQQEKLPGSALIEKPQDIIDITVEKFKTLKLPGSTEVTVKLKPEELGEVSLKLVLEKGQINGSITANSKEVVSMLQNNIEQLKADLKSSNVNLNNITVNIQSGEDFDSKNSRRGFSNRQNKNNNRMASAFEEEIPSYSSLEGFNIIA